MLTADEQAKLNAFAALTAAHPKLIEADRKVLDFVDQPAGADILLVLGPTGAGKTTLLERVTKAITEQRAETLNANPQLSPPLVFDCPASAGGNFAWSEFLLNGLEALDEPAYAGKAHVPSNPRLPIAPRSIRGVGPLRRAFQDAVGYRQPPAIFVDEAGHLANVGRGERLMAQLDFIKSLATASKSVFVLVGTYDLIALRNLSGQLGRRCREVHLSRYQLSDPTDRLNFQIVINTFAQQLPLDSDLLLVDTKWVYTRSAGCVGTLKQWLTRAYAAALADGTPIKRRHLEETALSTAALTEIAEEISLGEREMAETAQGLRDLELLLGVADEPIGPARRKQFPRKCRGRRPGRRSPGHDPVGTTSR
jgi:energy-coupling factor transporter ATP-binding protein EcfA2